MKFFKPLAVTAQVGYSVPTQSATNSVDAGSGLLTTTPNPQFLTWGGSLQYSMPYLKSSVMDLGLPDFLNHLIPLVEWNSSDADKQLRRRTAHHWHDQSRIDLRGQQIPVERRSDHSRQSCER